MNIIPELSPHDSWINSLPQSYSRLAGHFEQLANEIDRRSSEFWQMSDSEINAAFATLGAERTQTIFALQGQTVSAINELLAVLRENGFTNHSGAQTTPPRETTIENGNIVVVPIPEPQLDA